MLVRAATTVARLQTEVREYPFPEVAPDAGLLQVEAAGVCGSDWRVYNSDGPVRIMGRQSVGRIFRVGPIAAKRWGVAEHDRVLIDEYLACGHCRSCHSGDHRFCERTVAERPDPLRYGSIPLSEAPGLWGGYSQFQYLHPDSVLYRVPDSIPAELAALALPLANAFQWVLFEGGARPGKSILIQGPGVQGLTCIAAAKAAGAALIIVSGLTRDEKRLQVAKALGADHTIDVEKENPEERVRALSGGQGVHLSIDTVGAPDTLIRAIQTARKKGLVLLAAAPEIAPPDFELSGLLSRSLAIRPCRGHTFEAVDLALEHLAAVRSPLYLMVTHRFKLAQVDFALRSVGGQGAEGAIHITVLPWI
ncbi:MAG: zinc-binding dehydrogenase [Acidobacteriia bacterium]|nr:zinc-binding dehydrogenase [Terriglobia bacterium]